MTDMELKHHLRVKELHAAINREVERRRIAERKLREAGIE